MAPRAGPGARWLRFGPALTAACVLAVASGEELAGKGQAPSGTCPDGADLAADGSCARLQTSQSPRYAFVTLAVGGNDDRGFAAIWQVLPIAKVLQRFNTKFPLLLLTNTTHFPGGKDLHEAFSKLGVQVLPSMHVPIPASVGKTFRYKYWERAWQKLQIWRMTQYDKLIWMDSDAILTRSMDWLFQRPATWMMRDTWMCKMDETKPCSGIMLIEPSEATYQGLLRYADGLQKLPNADQELITAYFRSENTPAQLLDNLEASFGHCLSHVHGVNDTEIFQRHRFHSPWRLPAFVHKSSTNNECFSFDLRKQMRYVHGSVANVCLYNPLGSYWRDAFCKAVYNAGVATQKTEDFCDDGIWYADPPLPLR